MNRKIAKSVIALCLVLTGVNTKAEPKKRPSPPLQAIKQANKDSRSAPEPDGFQNALMVYDYEPNLIYQVYTRVGNWPHVFEKWHSQ